MLLSDTQFHEHKRRFRQSGEIDAALLALLRRIVGTFAKDLDPELSPHETWDAHAYDDALQGWYLKRLRRGALASAFDRSSAARPFLNRLEQNFRHYLENERPRSETGNILRRMRLLLRREPEFREWIPEARRRPGWWGLKSWGAPQPYGGSDDELVGHARQTGKFEVTRFGEDAQKLDPVLLNPELKRFLLALFSEVGALLTHAHLKIALQRRFDLDAVGEVVSLEAESERIGADKTEARASDAAQIGDGIDEPEVDAAARRCIGQISRRQSEVLARRFRRGAPAKLDDIAAELGIARGTVANDVGNAAFIAEANATESAPAGRILERMVEMLSISSDD
jgi:hypothetical protein